MNLKALLLGLALLGAAGAGAEHLVLLTTNDTHSNIDFDDQGRGGILPRKAIVDSVRKAEKNVLLIDAGDMVQGTLYFKYFKGDVEYPLFNMMNYDIRILGNHEFDNGLDELARYWKDAKADRLSANYDFSRTKAARLFKPYVVKRVAGKKIGFIGINIDPESLIARANCKGMVYSDAIDKANEWAEYLKNKEKCDLIVAVTHIGYKGENGRKGDIDLARESKYIDIIVGGHSHTFIDPKTPELTPYWISNALGKPVLVTQTGKYGRNVGYINIDLDDIASHKFDYEYIPVTDRFSPDAYDKEMQAFLEPYRAKVDSINNEPVGWSMGEYANSQGQGPLANWTADMGMWIGMQAADSLRAAGHDVGPVDFALMNVGGIRQTMPKGMVSDGLILSMFPFGNKMMLIRVKGSDIIATMGIVAPKGGEAVSDELRVVTDGNGKVLHVVLNGNEIDPEKQYTVCTIDYIAEGNDDMTPMARHELLWQDTAEIGVRVLQYMRHMTSLGIAVDPDPEPRFMKSIECLKNQQ